MGSSVQLAIESKCTEHLAQCSASFQESYDELVSDIAHDSWREVFQLVKAEPGSFKWLDVGQLIRHYLGLRRAVLSGAESIALLYLYWEPGDVEPPRGIVEHAVEVERLSGMVSDPDIPFSALSYRELWDRWTARGAPDWLLEQVTALRARYDVNLAAGASNAR